MSFQHISSGSAIFLDANTFVYAILGHPTYGPPSKALLDRVEQQDIAGYTSSHVLHETAHRVMTIEACNRFGWPAQGIARLRRHLDHIKQLVSPRRALDEIHAARAYELSVTAAHVSKAADIAQQVGLLSSDALVVAVMMAHGLTNLASLDPDFDRVAGITRYATI